MWLFALLAACADTPAGDGAPVDTAGDTDDDTDPSDTDDTDVSCGDLGDPFEDCDDSNAEIGPECPELCNGIDDNCDGVIDEGLTTTLYTDADRDTYGDPATATEGCAGAVDQVARAGDCDDTRADVHPDAADACEDALDADCDGEDPACAPAGSVRDAAARVHSDQLGMDLGRIVRIGDIDGDGQDDVVAGTFLAESQRGGAFAIPGPIVASGTARDLGWRIRGTEVGTGAGRSLAVGDLDGDGVDDIGIGAPYGARSGMFVVYGPHTGDSSLADAALLLGPASSYAGHGSDIGDVNGDGLADAVVGAYYADSPSGTVYVAFGPITGSLDLATEADAALIGEDARVYAGRIVSAGGDLDGDGVGDLVIACLGDLGEPASGGFYVVHGPPTDLDLAAADGRYAGPDTSDAAGLWLATGDIDGDGLADVVAAAFDDTLAETAGAAYVVNGPASDRADLSAADVIVRGDTAGQYGGGVAAGDLDGDGVMELLLGAQGDPTVGADGGAAFVFSRPAPGTYVFTDADRAFYAEDAGDNLGTGLAVGDVDGDGAPELVLGAPYEASGGSGAGAFYVLDVE